MSRFLCLSLLLALAGKGFADSKRPDPEQVRFFESKVRPLFVEHCQQCHGPKKQQGGLRLDTAAGFRAGGDSGSLVTAGKPNESLLLRAVRHEGLKMPPKKQLAPGDVAVLAEWVKRGAVWPETTVAKRPQGFTPED